MKFVDDDDDDTETRHVSNISWIIFTILL